MRLSAAEALTQRGNAVRRLGRLQEALTCYRQALVIEPTHIEALINQGSLLRELRRPLEALACFDRANALNPALLAVFINRGNVMRDLDRPSEALADYDRALLLDPESATLHSNRAGALNDLNRAADALASCDRAIALQPTYAEAHSNRGVLLGQLGRFTEADASMLRAIQLEPSNTRYHFNLGLSKRYTADDPQLATLQDLATRPLSEEQRVYLHFALAKALSDIGSRESAFQHYVAGNTLKRREVKYDESKTLLVLGRMQQHFTQAAMRAGAGLGAPSPVPVFIIGMPRSGSTLIEQILASLPGVYGAGEIDDFSKSIAACGGASQSIAIDSAEQLQYLGETYLARIQSRSPGALRIVNKTTENFRFAGLAHLALPNARIIHTTRDPADTCLSCFTHLFQNVSYTYDLGELGRYYRAYQATMMHWRQVLPEGVMLDVRYEDLVTDLEGQARRIVAHCGLDWDPRCLDFHLTERSVRTASSNQVRQPIYGSSIGRWREWEQFLGPLLKELHTAP